MPDVISASGLKSSAIYEKISRGEFPKPIPITGKAVAWDEDEILAWQNSRIAKRGVAT